MDDQIVGERTEQQRYLKHLEKPGLDESFSTHVDSGRCLPSNCCSESSNLTLLSENSSEQKVSKLHYEESVQLPENLEDFYRTKRKLNSRLWEAASKGDFGSCKVILKEKEIGPDTEWLGPGGLSALHVAAKNGQELVCKLLLPVTHIDVRDRNGKTPLHLCAKYNQVTTLKLLIKKGANINALDDQKNTPLHISIKKNNLEVTKVLISKSPCLHIANKHSHTAYKLLKLHNLSYLLNTDKLQVLKAESCEVTAMFKGNETVAKVSLPEESHVTLKDFGVISMLGKGSFGEVYLVQLQTTKELYAMKLLDKTQVLRHNLLKYAMTERNVLSRISHPFICSLHFAFQTNEYFILVLSYCSGGDLSYAIRREKYFSEETAKIYASEIILALEKLHQLGIVFRDLKPENVVLDSKGHAMLTDFGLCKEGIWDNTSAKSFCGSVAYLAPEVIMKKGHGMSVDWYLLGVLLYEMLVGIPPYFSNNQDQLFCNILRGKLKMPTRISDSAQDLIVKLLNRNPLKRLGSERGAEELKEHRFFQGTDWEAVYNRELSPPEPSTKQVIPSNFSTQQVVGDTCSSNRFQGWTFVQPNNL